MNYAVGRMLALEQADGFPFRHIHAVGSYGWDWMGDFVKDQGVDLAKAPRIEMKEYLYNMPTVMAAADVMICRAGASTCNEIAAAGIPCVLIPPNVTDNHQEKNARALGGVGSGGPAGKGLHRSGPVRHGDGSVEGPGEAPGNACGTP